jgi:pantoate--beta-alanine ligase
MALEPSIAGVRAWVRQVRTAGETIGFVPTMGALHAGHMSLVRRARAENARTVVSIFVNPTQFGPTEDLARYPRTMEADLAACRDGGVDLVFAPAVEEMYPPGHATRVDVERLTETLCGAKRPGHFRGVATVVTKLFNIVRPDRAYFGEKDAQQLRVVRRMVRDLDLDVEVVGCPIVREPDGLALSSRNAYLGPDDRAVARVLSRSLERVVRAHARGEGRAAALRRIACDAINGEPSAFIDYVEVVASDDLAPLDVVDREALLALAVRIGPCRLIDNVTLPGPRTRRRPAAARASAPSRRTARAARTAHP